MEKSDIKISIVFSLPAMLFIILLVLKLAFKFNIDWAWVLAPFWVPVSFVAGIIILIFVIAGFTSVVDRDLEE